MGHNTIRKKTSRKLPRLSWFREAALLCHSSACKRAWLTWRSSDWRLRYCSVVLQNVGLSSARELPHAGVFPARGLALQERGDDYEVQCTLAS